MKNCLAILIFLFGMTQVARSQQDKHPLLSDRFLFDIGIFIPAKSVQLRADGSDPNEIIDFSETFDLKDNDNTFFFKFDWRFGRMWSVSTEYFGVNNGNSAVLDSDIQFQDLIIKKGTFARAGVEMDVLRLFFSRIISQGQKHSLGAGLGIHGLHVGAFIEGEVKSSEGDKKFEKRDVDALIPLPNIGAHYAWAPSPKWYFIARVDWFGVSIDKYGGSLWNITPRVKYQIMKNVGVGIDYRMFFLDVNVKESSWKGAFEMDYSGPTLTLHANF